MIPENYELIVCVKISPCDYCLLGSVITVLLVISFVSQKGDSNMDEKKLDLLKRDIEHKSGIFFKHSKLIGSNDLFINWSQVGIRLDTLLNAYCGFLNHLD